MTIPGLTDGDGVQAAMDRHISADAREMLASLLKDSPEQERIRMTAGMAQHICEELNGRLAVDCGLELAVYQVLTMANDAACRRYVS